MTISVRLNEEDTALFKSYAALNNITLSELVRNAVMEKIEEEFDLKCYEDAIREYRENPKTYSLEEVERELGLTDV